MSLDQLNEYMRVQLNASRYQHSLGVEEVSYDLALIYGYDIEKACIAGILHDCAKYLSDKELLCECEKYNLPVTKVEEKSAYLLHAKVGAAFARYKYGIEDEEIVDAINYHTTGRPAMTLLEKIVFTGDYIEPYRKPLPRIDEIRKAAYSDLDLAVCMISENVLQHLNNSKKEIDTLTVSTYEYYKAKLQQDEGSSHFTCH